MYFKGKRIVIIGATGGLGSAYAERFLKEGAHVFLVGRSKEKLETLCLQLSMKLPIVSADITNEESLVHAAEKIKDWSDKIDIVINATGYDVRKSLLKHSPKEIEQSLSVNLLGSILITKVFLPLLKDEKGSTIVHSGGFVDGRLAFPYYSADIASRAGLFSFLESMNRELKQEKSTIRLTYFCPNAANTEAEMPFHKVWKEMGIRVSSVDEVADALLKGLRRQNKVIFMGRGTGLFAKLNLLSPSLADRLLLNKYDCILQKYLG
ncbi:SDR family NAD(P)-dependent oxidoreductase [Streptococcus orisasini]